MDLYEGLITRRSIRSYTGGQIDSDKIEMIVRAGMYAPSAHNKRPWIFIVITDRDILGKIMAVHPASSMLKEASHAVAVCGDLNKQHGPGYYLLDCAAVVQNILLAAHSLGYGAVWLGVEPRQERVKAISEILCLPGHICPVSIVSIGVPSGRSPETPERYEPEKIYLNRWESGS